MERWRGEGSGDEKGKESGPEGRGERGTSLGRVRGGGSEIGELLWSIFYSSLNEFSKVI